MPLLRGVAFLDRKHAVSGRRRPAAGQETARPRFAPDPVELGEQEPVVPSDILKSNLWHQLIDVDEGLLFRRHGKGKKKGVRVHSSAEVCKLLCSLLGI